MNITDNIILEKFYNKLGRPSNKKLLVASEEELLYLKQRYNDSDSLMETLYRIKNNIDNKPICKCCGKILGYPFNKGGYCSRKCMLSYTQNDRQIKTASTKLKKYGSISYNNQEKIKKTCLEKYGVEHCWSNKIIREKCKNTSNIIYGTDNPSKSYEIKNKIKQTCVKKYGVITPLLLDNIRTLLLTDEIKEKRYLTHKYNNSFNTSKPEDDYYILLKEKYPDVIRQYTDDRYPFNCDFYIPSEDLFIECNFSWTHGGHPYDENNIDDIKLAEKWRTSKSKYYNNAYITWTQRDVNKRNIAKENKLNYIEIYK